jgi:hypothetical protein
MRVVVGMRVGRAVFSRKTDQTGEDQMRFPMLGRGLLAAVLIMCAGSVLAQNPPVRVRGEIEKVEGNVLRVKGRDPPATRSVLPTMRA